MIQARGRRPHRRASREALPTPVHRDLSEKPRHLIAGEPWPPQGEGFQLQFNPAEQHVILPQSVNAEVFARIALAHEPGVFQQPDRGGIRRNAGRFETMQAQRIERERHQRAHCAGHQAAARKRLADPVADAARLRDAATDIGKRQAADERMIVLAEQEERIGLVRALVLGITPQPAAECRAARDRPPARSAPTASGTRGSPRARSPTRRSPTSAARADNLLAFDRRQRLGETDSAEESHGQ